MRILSISPVASSGGGKVRLVASFDIRLDEHVRIFGLRLMETADGRHVVYAPNGNGGRRLATFSPELAAEITKAATEQLKGHDTANGTTSENQV